MPLKVWLPLCAVLAADPHWNDLHWELICWANTHTRCFHAPTQAVDTKVHILVYTHTWLEWLSKSSRLTKIRPPDTCCLTRSTMLRINEDGWAKPTTALLLVVCVGGGGAIHCSLFSNAVRVVVAPSLWNELCKSGNNTNMLTKSVSKAICMAQFSILWVQSYQRMQQTGVLGENVFLQILVIDGRVWPLRLCVFCSI